MASWICSSAVFWPQSKTLRTSTRSDLARKFLAFFQVTGWRKDQVDCQRLYVNICHGFYVCWYWIIPQANMVASNIYFRDRIFFPGLFNSMEWQIGAATRSRIGWHPNKPFSTIFHTYSKMAKYSAIMHIISPVFLTPAAWDRVKTTIPLLFG